MSDLILTPDLLTGLADEDTPPKPPEKSLMDKLPEVDISDLKPTPDEILPRVHAQTSEVTPDQAISDLRGAGLGFTPKQIQENPQIKAYVSKPLPDFPKIQLQAPATARWLTHPPNYAVSQDDHPALIGAEKRARGIGWWPWEIYKSIASWHPALLEMGVEAFRTLREFGGVDVGPVRIGAGLAAFDYDGQAGKALKRLTGIIQKAEEKYYPVAKDAGPYEQMFLGGVRSVGPSMASMLPGLLIGGPVAGAVGGAGLFGAAEYTKFIDDWVKDISERMTALPPSTPEAAELMSTPDAEVKRLALASAAVEFSFEFLSDLLFARALGPLVAPVKKTAQELIKEASQSFTKRLAQQGLAYGARVGTEASTEYAQAYLETLFRHWSGMANQYPLMAAWQAFGSGLVMAFFLGGVPFVGKLSSQHKLNAALRHETNQAKAGKEVVVKFVEAADKFHAESKMLPRSPEAAKSFVKNLIDDGQLPDKVYVEPEFVKELFQDNPDVDPAEILESLGKQYEEYLYLERQGTAVDLLGENVFVQGPGLKGWDKFKQNLNVTPAQDLTKVIETMDKELRENEPENQPWYAEYQKKLDDFRQSMIMVGRPAKEARRATQVLEAIVSTMTDRANEGRAEDGLPLFSPLDIWSKNLYVTRQIAEGQPVEVPVPSGGMAKAWKTLKQAFTGKSPEERVLAAYSELSGGQGNTRVYLNELREKFPDLKPAEFDKMMLDLQAQGKAALYSLDVPQEVTPEREAGGVKLPSGVSREIVYMDLPKAQAEAPRAKEPWEMTNIEFSRSRAPESIKSRINVFQKSYAGQHKKEIKAAIDEGKIIPSEVLAEYPDLFQKSGEKPPKGKISFGLEYDLITLFNRADASTTVHEFAHWAKERLAELAAIEGVSQSIKDMWTEVHALVGLEVGQEWQTIHDEKLAKGFEAYLREGKAPSLKLQKVFEFFRKMLNTIYRTMRDLYIIPDETAAALSGKKAERIPIRLTDEARVFYDKLLATDEEIELAKIQAADTPLWTGKDFIEDSFLKTLPPGVSERYLELLKEHAANEAPALVIAAREREIEKNIPVWRKLGKDLADQDPVQMIMDQIVKDGGLNYNSMRSDFDKDTILQIARKRRGMVSKKGKLILDEFTELLGYETDSALIMDLMNAKTKPELIQEYVDMETARHLELRDLADVVHGQWNQELIEMEIQLLNQKLEAEGKYQGTHRTNKERLELLKAKTDQESVGYTLIPVDQARAFAQKKAARAARAAKAEGKTEAMLLAKERYRDLMLQRKVKESARKEIRRIKDYFERIIRLKPSALDVQTGIAWPYLQQIKALLGRYMGSVPPTFRASPDTPSLREFVDELRDQNEVVLIEDHIIDGPGMPLHQMTLEALRSLRDAVKNLETIGRNDKLLLANKRHQYKQAAVNASVQSIRDNKTFTKPGGFETVTKNKNVIALMGRFLKGYHAGLMLVEFICNNLDGFKLSGEVFHNVFQWAETAQNYETSLRKKIVSKLKEATAKLPKSYWAEWRKTLYHVPGVENILSDDPKTSMWTREQMVMVAMNAGNQGNIDSLMRGYGLSEEMVLSLIDKLNDQEWQFVQDVWQVIGEPVEEGGKTLYELLDNVTYLMTGIHPPKVEGQLISLPSGRQIQGQYFPNVGDPKLSETARRRETERSLKNLFMSPFARPSTKAGASYARKGSRQPPLLSYDVVGRHIDEVTHDITHGPGVRDAFKIINSQEFRNAVEGTLGPEIYQQFAPWLQNIARPIRVELAPVEKLMRWMRLRTTTVMLAAKATTAAKQLLSLNQTIDEIGLAPTLKGVFMYLSSPRDAKDFVFTNSPEVANRDRMWERDIGELSKKYTLPNQELGEQFKQLCFAPLRIMDNFMANSSWLAAYNLKLAELGKENPRTHDLSVEYANQVVRRTQGTGATKDRSWIHGHQHEAVKLVTMFYSFFQVFYNKLTERHYQFASGDISFARLALSYWWLVMVPAVLESIVSKRRLPEDPEEWAQAIISYLSSGVPILRDVVNSGITGWGYQFTPAAEGFEAMGGTVRDAWTLVFKHDKFKPRKAAVRAVGTAGYVFGLPGRQMQITLDGLLDLISGKTQNPLRLIAPEIKEKKK